MSKYSYETKLEVVKAYLEGDISTRALGQKYEIDHGKIRQWVGRYRAHGAEGLYKKRNSYTAAFKLSVLQRMWQEKLSYRETSAVFNIRSPWCLAKWERSYHEGGIEALAPQKKGRCKAMHDKNKPPPDAADDQRSREELLAELNQLRMENAYLKKLDALVRARQTPTKRK